jgi:hypothetical protein
MIKNTPEKCFNFIPFRKHDIVEMCLKDNLLSDQETEFRHLSSMLSSIYHFEYHNIIESLKDSYALIDPDSDTRKPLATELDKCDNFSVLLNTLLEKANYERITEDELNQALNESSLFKIRLHVDFDDFEEVLLFCRGESIREEKVPQWLGLSSKTITFINYDRVVVYIRLSKDYQESKNSLPFSKPGATLLKLFQNVPKADLEMLFPNTQVRMRTIDKLLIGIPALISGSIVLTTKLGAALILLGSLLGFWFGLSQQPVELNKTTILVLLAGMTTLGGYLWKQFSNFKNRKLRFMQSLTQNLYFKNLDNNAGVFHRLANDAEEEEGKEALLAYYFLLISKPLLSKSELDRQIETWLLEKWHCAIDFEIDDAVTKLLNIGLIKKTDNTLVAISIAEAIRVLDQRWDNYFTHDNKTFE